MGGVTLGYYLHTGSLIITKQSDAEKAIQDKLGSEYVYVIDYTRYHSGDINLIFPIIVKDEMKLKSIQGSTSMSVVENIINEINSYDYNVNQSNPHLIKEHGGNCQAKSLLFKAYADKYDIKNKVVYTKTHMYNEVEIGDKWYVVDLVKSKFNLKEV
ncbi:hypothetical protein UT300012_23450 [Paraclostridium bifermentans]